MTLVLQLKLEAIYKTMKKQDENTTQTTVPTGVVETTDGETTSPEDITLTRLQAENAELKEAVRVSGAREQITNSLREAGARSPSLLFDSVKSDLQFADDGSLTNAEAIVKRLTKRFPEQLGNETVHRSIDGGAGRVTGTPLTKEALGKMTPAEIAKLDWAAVREVLAS